MTEKIYLPWIDKNERGPDEEERIICVDLNSRHKEIEIGEYHQEYGEAFYNNEYPIAFTHWIPESWFELPKMEEK